MNPHFTSYVSSPIGIIEINADDKHILSVTFLDDEEAVVSFSENEVSKYTKQQLIEYFAAARNKFDVTLNFSGTDFQNKVWKELCMIPFGKTISYEVLALKLGDLKCIRAAASANGKNPFAIIVPCHRVIGKNGALTGYAGGLWRKQWLLEHEKSIQKQTALF